MGESGREKPGLADEMHYLRRRNYSHFFLQIRQHFAQYCIRFDMRVGDADGFTAIVGDLDQLVDLPADEIRVHDMIDKYIPLGKSNLKQAR